MLKEWAIAWGVPDAALVDLYARLSGTAEVHPIIRGGTPEKVLQDSIRREGRDKGILLMRNNVGALCDDTGRMVRYGLANDSKTVNEHIKSGDLVGIRPVSITLQHVGQTIGQFVSRECKRPGWRYHPNDKHEAAQMRWCVLINSKGGDAMITDHVGTL